MSYLSTLLLSSPNYMNDTIGRKAVEEAREGIYEGVNFARLLVTSAEFRDELVEALGKLNSY